MRTEGCDGDCITSLTIPQMRCLAPSSKPPIEPVVSSTKTISSVDLLATSPAVSSELSTLPVSTGSIVGDWNTQAVAILMPITNVNSAMPILNVSVFIFDDTSVVSNYVV